MYDTKWKQSEAESDERVVIVVTELEEEFSAVDGQLTVPDDKYDSIIIELYNMSIDEAQDTFTDMERHILNKVGVSGYSIGTSGKEATVKFV